MISIAQLQKKLNIAKPYGTNCPIISFGNGELWILERHIYTQTYSGVSYRQSNVNNNYTKSYKNVVSK